MPYYSFSTLRFLLSLLRTVSSKATLLTGLLVCAVSMTACQPAKKNENADKAQTSEQKQIPSVDVFNVTYSDIPKTIALTGKVVAYQTAEVRPQVSGILAKKMFIEGSFVQKDQPLFQIDAVDYEKAVANHSANLSRHAAHLKTLRVKRQGLLNNTAVLEGKSSLSNKERKQLIAQLDAEIALAKADIKLTKSKLDKSQLDLSRTVVRAPISGKTSLSEVASGSFVSSNQDVSLVQIYQMDPVYVDIQQPVEKLHEESQQITEGILQNLTKGAQVQLILADGQVYDQKGRITFSGANINQESEAVKVRAVFGNEDRQLLSGMAVTAKITHGDYSHAFVLPKTAVIKNKADDTQETHTNNKLVQPKQPRSHKTHNHSQISVYVVSPDNEVVIKQLTTHGEQDDSYVITEGIKEGERIVTNAQNLSEGMKVTPVLPTPIAEPTLEENAMKDNMDEEFGRTFEDSIYVLPEDRLSENILPDENADGVELNNKLDEPINSPEAQRRQHSENTKLPELTKVM